MFSREQSESGRSLRTRKTSCAQRAPGPVRRGRKDFLQSEVPMSAPCRVLRPPSWRALVHVALVIAVTGCTGVIESPQGQTRTGSGSGAGSGAGGVGAGGVGPGGVGAGMAGAACAVAPVPVQ